MELIKLDFDMGTVIFYQALNLVSAKSRCVLVSAIYLILIMTIPSKAYSTAWTEHAKPTLTEGFDHKGLGIIALGGLGVLLAQPHDYRNRSEWIGYQKMSSDTARIGDKLGSGYLALAVLIPQWFLDKESAISHSEALATTFLATSILKEANHRHRPNSENPHSMPSGHTSFTFATATSLAYSYGWVAAVPSYLLGVFVAASRWSDDAHWLSDTVAGAAVGIFWGRAASLHHLGILPVAYSDGGGFLWTAHF